jgi:hypothetical protein
VKVSAATKELFCEALLRGQSPVGAARAIRVDRATAYRWRAGDPTFAEAWIAARETKIELVETVLYRMVREKDLGAICFFLKAHKPEIYNRRIQIAVGSDPDDPLSIDHLHHGDASEMVHIYMPPNGRDQLDPDEALAIVGEADDEAP